MVIEVLETHVLIGTIGFVLGFIATRIYYKRIVRNVALGQVIDYSMIHNNVQQIESLSFKLNSTISDLKIHSDDLLEQMQDFQDIEKNHQQGLFKENSLFDLTQADTIKDDDEISDLD
jgi:hypothetical protein